MEESTIQAIEPIRLEDSEPMTFAGLAKRFDMKSKSEIPALWASMDPYWGRIPGQVGRLGYGVVYDAMTDGVHFTYLAGVQVSSPEGLPAELSHVELPARRYAVFSHPDHLSTLPETLNAIYRRWLPTSGFTAANGMLEVYGESFNPETLPGGIELWIPLET
jgi:AraC family transcriptional regulator